MAYGTNTNNKSNREGGYTGPNKYFFAGINEDVRLISVGVGAHFEKDALEFTFENQHGNTIVIKEPEVDRAFIEAAEWGGPEVADKREANLTMRMNSLLRTYIPEAITGETDSFIEYAITIDQLFSDVMEKVAETPINLKLAYRGKVLAFPERGLFIERATGKPTKLEMTKYDKTERPAKKEDSDDASEAEQTQARTSNKGDDYSTVSRPDPTFTVDDFDNDLPF